MSVGQRQIIALARAIVRNSKLLILDEGMPMLALIIEVRKCLLLIIKIKQHLPLVRLFILLLRFVLLKYLFVDHKTDSIIQESLRNELGSDVTVLTVAHRLQTIMDADKIVCFKDLLHSRLFLLTTLHLFQMVLDEGKIVRNLSNFLLSECC